MEVEVIHKEVVKPYVGKWVHCHSIYGMHAGLLHRALHDGIVLIHPVALAAGSERAQEEIRAEAETLTPEQDVRQAQFILPFPGMFIPYGGIFGIWPRPAIII
ncbi:hypothetical protein [Alicyclobacillus sp.]|uniref:hypothetical protein n=1 Tax=Alicyclobacillus sp. TaxID=61169 RepID=UPI0025BE2B70|nr:hypothetical protein [Alicyclobacillus sp.]MCL6517964.1 hypothetical protein [Alicyclobacillus sp.]